MKLSDVVGGAGLAIYAEVAMVIFLAVFVAVVMQIVSSRRAAEWEEARNLPLSDDGTPGRSNCGGREAP